MTAQKTPHEWSKDALFLKAQRYAQEMLEQPPSDWRYALWAALTMEMVVRSAIANVSPTLLADGRDWNNILYAIGKEPNQKRFVPRTADISDLLKRTENLFPSFTSEMLNFCISFMQQRNSELHTGSIPFDGVKTSTWLPMFYSACLILLSEINEDISTLFNKDIAKEADSYIEAIQDKSSQEVKSMIKAHQTVWEGKAKEEKDKLKKQAEILSSRHFGHRVDCPSCGSQALLIGSPTGPTNSIVDLDEIMEQQAMLPDRFECIACGLKISGISKLVACGLGDTYISTSTYTPLEYFDIDIEEAYRGMADDNNEYLI